jgi:hypothetical protein
MKKERIMEQKQAKEALDTVIKGTNGRVKAEWQMEPWGSSGSSVKVLQLSIVASTRFQIRALHDAMIAARKISGSFIGMDTSSMFQFHGPTADNASGYLSIQESEALNPVFAPYVKRAIFALSVGKEYADKFNIKDVETAAQSAFGDNVTSCKTEGYKRQEQLKVTVSYKKISAFREVGQKILAHVSKTICGAIPDNRAGLMDLRCQAKSSREIEISFNPAYADEFSKACNSLENKLSPQAVKEQLTL